MPLRHESPTNVPFLKKIYSVEKKYSFLQLFSGLGMIQVSTGETDLGFGTIRSKNSPIQNISKIGHNTRPVGGSKRG